MSRQTGCMRGEFVDIDAQDLKPYDILGEGRVVRQLKGDPYGWDSMEVGPCRAVVEVLDLAVGLRCLWQPEWTETHIEGVPAGTIRVFRGDLPGYFCEFESGQTDDLPCGSSRCPQALLTDGDGA